MAERASAGENARNLAQVRADDYLTTDDVAALLRVRRQTVYSWVDQGLLPCRRLGVSGRLLRFTRADIDHLFTASESAR